MSFSIGQTVVHVSSRNAAAGVVTSVWDASYGVNGPGVGFSPLLIAVPDGSGVAQPTPYLVGNVIGVTWPSKGGSGLYPQEDLVVAV